MAKQTAENRWRRRLARWQRSGKTVTEFCRREGVSKPTFYAWRKRLEEREVPSVEFVELDGMAGSDPARIELEVRGVTVRLRAGFDASDLRSVIAILEERR